jgi:hypothetical protein
VHPPETAVEESNAELVETTKQLPEEESMTETFQIDLQEGFDGDTVVIQVNGREEYHEHNVTTSLLTGYAHTISAQVPPGQVNIEILIPTRNISKTEFIEMPEHKYLGVSVQHNEIETIKSSVPFGYG